MSWSARFEIVNGDIIEDSIVMTGVDVEHHKDQYEAAVGAVWHLLNSKSLGVPEVRHRVVFSGHGNPGHVPTDGWSNDFISLVVTQVTD